MRESLSCTIICCQTKARVSTMLNRRLHGILCEVFKSIKGSNSKCFNDLFEVKSTSYSLHNDNRLIQPKRRTANSGLWTVSYLGAKLWNDNLALFVDTIDGEICTFKSSLKYRWHHHKAIDLPYVWYKRGRTMYNAYLCVHNVYFILYFHILFYMASYMLF